MTEKKDIKGVLNKLFNKPQALEVGEGEDAAKIFIRPLTEDEHEEYAKIFDRKIDVETDQPGLNPVQIPDPKAPKYAIKYLISLCAQDEEGNRIFLSPEDVNLPVGLNELTRKIMQLAMGTQLSEFETKN